MLKRYWAMVLEVRHSRDPVVRGLGIAYRYRQANTDGMD